MVKKDTHLAQTTSPVIRVTRLETDNFDYVDTKLDSRIGFNIVIVCPRDAVLLGETINFLKKTGMPSAAFGAIIVRNANNEYYQYGNAIDQVSNNKYVYKFWNVLRDIPNFSRGSYSLFLISGAKISWGSVECLYRAAQEKPDASFISAVFRGRTGRVVFPNGARTTKSILHYCKSWFFPKKLNFVSSFGYYKEAVLIRNDILDMSCNQFQTDCHELPLLEDIKTCILICVPSAQIISLGHGIRKE